MGEGARSRACITSTTNKQGGVEVKGGSWGGGGWGGAKVPGAGDTNIRSQEIVRGHLYFITMISSLHLPRAALSCP